MRLQQWDRKSKIRTGKWGLIRIWSRGTYLASALIYVCENTYAKPCFFVCCFNIKHYWSFAYQPFDLVSLKTSLLQFVAYTGKPASVWAPFCVSNTLQSLQGQDIWFNKPTNYLSISNWFKNNCLTVASEEGGSFTVTRSLCKF